MPPKPKGHRLGIPFVIAGLALLGTGVIRLQPELEQNFKSWLTSLVVLLALVLAFLWFLFLSRIVWRLRLAAFGIVALSVFGLSKMLRVQGTVNGSGLPKLVWRWSAAPAERFQQVPVPGATTLPIASATLESMANVPQFFGPNRDGTVKNGRLARDWTSAAPKQLWRQAVGAGWSAFAVVDGRAYTQEQRGENECVTCYELLSGHLLWTHTNAVHFSQWQGGDGPRATPTVLEGRVFAMGATGLLDCLDAKTGLRLWTRDVLAENKLPNLVWGISDSPLVFDETVVVTGGLTAGPTVLAYRRSDGAPLWRSGTDKASYASPVLASLAGRRLVLSCNAASLTAHDPATGERKWKDGHFGSGQTLLVDDLALIQSEPGPMILAEAKPDGFRELGRIQALSAKTWNHPTLAGRYLLVRNSEEMACYELPGTYLPVTAVNEKAR